MARTMIRSIGRGRTTAGGTRTATRSQANRRNAAQFFEDKLRFTTGPVELDHMIEDKRDIVIVDVREPEDYQQGHVPGAVNLPREKWSTLEGLSKNQLNVLYCYSQTCHLAAQAAFQFAKNGLRVMEMEGGFEAWRKAELDIEGTPEAQPLAKAA